MEKALLELKNNGTILDDLVIDYKKSDSTYILNDILYYKNITEGLLLLVNKKFNNEIIITNHFENFGTMIDVSRGAVFKVSYIKDLIRKKALMGMNEIWLYMEDVYELENYPVFGYLRGKYSKEELKEIVSYAKIFDITLVPAIQTLGHMEQYLRWYKTHHFRDQDKVLLVRYEETYKLIEEMLTFFYEVFETKKIHIGLDETFGFGFGLFYKKNGYIPPMDLFLEHLNKVNDIALKVGFTESLMWSDMFFRFLSKTEYYYDPNIVLDYNILSKIPKNVTLVYWDYYNKNDEIVNKMLENHVKTNFKTVFASGTWIWTRLNYDKKQTDLTAKMHLQASMDNEVKDFILTQWMDDGAYGDHYSTMLGNYELSILAKTDQKLVNEEVFNYVTKMDYQKELNRTKINDYNYTHVGLLWDDPLYSAYLNNYVNNDLSKLNKIIEEHEELIRIYESDSYYCYEYNIVLANYYKIKAKKNMIISYNNKESINIEAEFKNQIAALERLNEIIRNRWYQENKPNGLEIIQSRISTQIIRAKEMIYYINLYNNKEFTVIEALEEDIAIFDEPMSLKHADIAFTTKPF